jgi:hypothetical protein
MLSCVHISQYFDRNKIWRLEGETKVAEVMVNVRLDHNFKTHAVDACSGVIGWKYIMLMVMANIFTYLLDLSLAE